MNQPKLSFNEFNKNFTYISTYQSLQKCQKHKIILKILKGSLQEVNDIKNNKYIQIDWFSSFFRVKFFTSYHMIIIHLIHK